MAWAGSTVAPWCIALGLLVSITARADPDAGISGGAVEQNGSGERFSPVHEALSAAVFRAGAGDSTSDPWLVPVHLTLGARDELAAIPDEIEPKAAFKRAKVEIPAIDRAHKGDPFIALRPGLGAHASRPAPAIADAASDAGWPADSRSPAALASVETAPTRPIEAFSDGATPSITLDWALNSSTPGPSEGKLIVGGAHAQTTIAGKSDFLGKPDYASLIDPKDSARQMRCLAEAVYFESRSEPENGQAAVAQVVLNRVRSGIFPTDVCGVVYQDRNHPFACQFSFACEGKSLRIEEPSAWAVATRIAKEVVKGANFNPKVAEALNYHANYVMPFWAPSLRRVDRIGAHIFYAMRPGTNWAPGALNGRGDLPPLQASAK